MAEPPSYEKSISEHGYQLDINDSKDKADRTWNISSEVDISRSQHVAATVARLLQTIRDRSKSGLSRTTLVLLPSNIGKGGNGQLVGFPEDQIPIMIELEGRENSTEFWSQQQAVKALQDQLSLSLYEAPPKIEESLPPREEPRGGSFFGRKNSKQPVLTPVGSAVATAPVTVAAALDDVYFRTENAFGLMETVRRQAVMVSVEV